MTTKQKPLAGIRFGVVGKGGAGKSTVTLAIARVLRKYDYDVCILDADSTNMGLYKLLDLEQPPESLIDFFGGMVFSGGSVTCPVDDPTPLPNAELSLEEISPEYYAQNQDGITLLTAGKIGDLGPGAGCDGPINKIARDVSVNIGDKKPVTLVDFKAGFEDSARGAITSLDWILAVVDPTQAAIQMAIHMKMMIEKLKAGVPPATEHLESPELIQLAQTLFKKANVQGVLAILNRLRDPEMRKYIEAKLHEEDVDIIGDFEDDPAITSSWLRGIPFEGTMIQQNTGKIMTALKHIVENQV